MIKAIVFDMGGVLLESRWEDVTCQVAKNLKIESKRLEGLQEWGYDQAVIGKEHFDVFLEKVIKERKLEISLKKLLTVWNKSYLEVMTVNRPVLELAQKLKYKYVVGLVSNLNEFHGKINIERGLFKSFEPCILSYQVGLQKPDKKIFDLLISELKMDPTEVVFIDDREKHLSEPKKMGMHCIVFENNAQLERDLKKLGVTW